MKGAPRKTRYVKATQLKEDNMAVYTLPELPYDYSALEPYISGEIMELHHDKHHKAYVDGANTALDKLAEARDKADFGAINKLEKDLAFNLAGHVNHSVFWKNMAPKGSAPERPTDELGAAIDEFFGSFDNMKAQFTAAATGIPAVLRSPEQPAGRLHPAAAARHVGARLLPAVQERQG